jgi:hypothetical protein
LTKLLLNKKDSISITIPQRLLEKTLTVPSLIDYYGNESKATILTENTETKRPKVQ